jgi:aromatic ring-opening dioxygenase catalytic subunit (LigB family)
MDWDPPHTWDAMAEFLRTLPSQLPRPPRAIVMVSAHWLAPEFTLTQAAQPELIFDYFGFPPHTYELEYPAAGAPDLAAAIQQRLRDAGLAAAIDGQRGYDHGMFIPLLLMYPHADIPVIQLSLQQNFDPDQHLAVGAALAQLREQDVLIIGSGMSFHNMRGYGDPRFTPISAEFDAWLTQAVSAPASERTALLSNWTAAPQARLCHPPRAEEHLLPLMVVAGAAGNAPGQKVFSDRVLETTISAFRFG